VRDMTTPRVTVPSLRVVVDAARQFGLTDPEIWDGVEAALAAVPQSDTAAQSLDEVAGELARLILARERRVRAERRRALQDRSI
jgi:hypothetical protein